MRVTDSMIHMGLTDNIQRGMARLNKNYNQLTTGKMINRPSDDPVGLILGMRLRRGLRRVCNTRRTPTPLWPC